MAFLCMYMTKIRHLVCISMPMLRSIYGSRRPRVSRSCSCSSSLSCWFVAADLVARRLHQSRNTALILPTRRSAAARSGSGGTNEPDRRCALLWARGRALDQRLRRLSRLVFDLPPAPEPSVFARRMPRAVRGESGRSSSELPSAPELPGRNVGDANKLLRRVDGRSSRASRISEASVVAERWRRCCEMRSMLWWPLEVFRSGVRSLATGRATSSSSSSVYSGVAEVVSTSSSSVDVPSMIPMPGVSRLCASGGGASSSSSFRRQLSASTPARRMTVPSAIRPA